MPSIAPGPGLGLLPLLKRLRREPLWFLMDAQRTYGDVVRLGTGSWTVHILNHPELADHVLRAHHANYDRETRSGEAVRTVTGESLVTSSGETWRRHRLTIQPSFSREALRQFEPAIERATDAMLDRWTRAGEIDLVVEMTRLTSTIVAKVLFGTELEDDADRLTRLLPLILQTAYARSTSLVPLHRFLRDRKFDAARAELLEIVDRFPPKWPELGAEASRNEMLAMLLAGHETTANALTWTFWLLSQHPDVEVSGTAAFEEALRLYPPIWIVERRAIEDDVIGGYDIPAGTLIYVSPYVLHRHPGFWSEPDRFDPARFAAGEKHAAFLPFGAGPHHCIGAGLAMLEASVIVPRVMQRCRLEALAEVEPQAWITLRPRGAVPMRAHFRSKSSHRPSICE